MHDSVVEVQPLVVLLGSRAGRPPPTTHIGALGTGSWRAVGSSGTEIVESPCGVYRTAQGMIFRVSECGDEGLRIEIPRDGMWGQGRLGMIGLRLESSTTKLGPSAVIRLPG